MSHCCGALRRERYATPKARTFATRRVTIQKSQRNAVCDRDPERKYRVSPGQRGFVEERILRGDGGQEPVGVAKRRAERPVIGQVERGAAEQPDGGAFTADGRTALADQCQVRVFVGDLEAIADDR